jgi:hypothetical protein
MASKRLRGLAAVIAAAVLTGAAAASPPPRAVIELFTSQGCSSCPPADRVLAELAREPDVVALSLHVDYWDYLGWKDTLAQPAFSARQRAYASARGDHQVFTPQMVVNGKAICVGAERSQVERSVAEANGTRASLPVAIDVKEAGAAVVVEVGAGAAGLPRKAEVWVLPVVRSRDVAIGRGENKGRRITYTNVVRGMTRAGDWTGAPARFEVPLHQARAGDADGYVVILQATEPERPGAILGATKGPGL